MILRNSAKCAHCGIELESVHRHSFKTHVCSAAGKIAREYNHDLQEYVPAYPSFSVDGGKDYIRRLFTREEDYVETSEFGP
jgi:hypothetical protein